MMALILSSGEEIARHAITDFCIEHLERGKEIGKFGGRVQRRLRSILPAPDKGLKPPELLALEASTGQMAPVRAVMK